MYSHLKSQSLRTALSWKKHLPPVLQETAAGCEVSPFLLVFSVLTLALRTCEELQPHL